MRMKSSLFGLALMMGVTQVNIERAEQRRVKTPSQKPYTVNKNGKRTLKK